ncbi:hypothetical protein BDB00DRAFT_79056 [Zychaea mexicana]|uniref:uncharacterized protein n=1 Tax=Zychaea mexicana TaxID=64656 RepID=UPI0022FEFFBC|nr:uncharacterized protein BDB00DRAFT_79056 [Zychaea mexicana]KAI9496912.1 hypothetical protein BDB00DRAFT_79056 [Zychaea mexicana]
MSASYQGSSFDWSKKRKSNTKYLTTYEEDDDEEPESRTRRLQDRGNGKSAIFYLYYCKPLQKPRVGLLNFFFLLEADTLSTSVSAYATSMPIAISHNNDSSFSDAMKTMANNEKSKAVNPADQDPTINNSSATATSSSMQKNDAQQNNKEYTIPTGSSLVSRTQAYDQFSLADQEASKLFPTAYLERRRKSVAATGATPRPQLDSLIGQSLDTRQRRRSPSITATAARNNHSSYNNNNNTSSSNSFIASTTTDQYLSRQQQQQQQHHESNSDDEHQVGPMVPPHILAASTYTDETEELFGAVPRSNTWRKTYD